jgi:phospholipid/cholesterol/gamma-HCH transport system substrate-binding protein
VRFSKEFKVGLFAIGTITMFYMGFNFLKGIEFFSRTNRYYVIYEDAGGLTKSNPVTISGFNVGRVADIRLLQDNGNIVLVALDIDRNIILGDSAVAILDANFLGEVSIVVNVGNILRPISPLDTLYSRVDPGLTEMLVSSAQPITDNLPLTIANFNALLDSLGKNSDELNKTMQSIRYTSYTINKTLIENSDGIKSSIEGFKELSKKVNATMDVIKPMLTKYSELADSLKNMELANTVKKLNIMLDETAATFNAFRNKESTLGKLMYEDSLYNNLNSTMLALDSLLIHMNENPKHFFGPLGKSKKKIEKDLAKQQKQ